MPSFDTRGRRERLALTTYVRLLRAANAARTFSSQHIANADLTLTQFTVLEALYHLGPMPLSDIAQKLLTTGGNLTLVVSNLEKRGFAERQRSPQDGRVFVVVLTSKGKTLMRDIFPKHAERIARFFRVLNANEQQKLGELCRKLGTQEP